jgi:hypothetical protein
MSKKDEALKQALEAMEQAHDESLDENHFECRQILMGQITALRKAQEDQPEEDLYDLAVRADNEGQP